MCVCEFLERGFTRTCVDGVCVCVLLEREFTRTYVDGEPSSKHEENGAGANCDVSR